MNLHSFSTALEMYCSSATLNRWSRAEYSSPTGWLDNPGAAGGGADVAPPSADGSLRMVGHKHGAPDGAVRVGNGGSGVFLPGGSSRGPRVANRNHKLSIYT